MNEEQKNSREPLRFEETVPTEPGPLPSLATRRILSRPSTVLLCMGAVAFVIIVLGMAWFLLRS